MIGFIGGGNMAEALIKGINSKDILVSEPRSERRQYLTETYAVTCTASNKDVVTKCDIIILAVKPQVMDEVVAEIAPVITEDKTVVSIAAGITLEYFRQRLKTNKLIRVMPNTPALVQKAMSVMSLNEGFEGKDVSLVRDIFLAVGSVIILPEHFMNAVTALSGSGPGFMALFVEHLIEAGVKLGLSKSHAEELAIQTFIGTAYMLQSGVQPSRLREMVTSPQGTTQAGLKVFEERDFKGLIYEALLTASNRASELGKK